MIYFVWFMVGLSFCFTLGRLHSIIRETISNNGNKADNLNSNFYCLKCGFIGRCVNSIDRDILNHNEILDHHVQWVMRKPQGGLMDNQKLCTMPWPNTPAIAYKVYKAELNGKIEKLNEVKMPPNFIAI